MQIKIIEPKGLRDFPHTKTVDLQTVTNFIFVENF